ncbi:MAG: TetR/AcrR family transcriptional regulator [Deltaproteobacteria bacterium]|nr:TetR/AcrR family transcriptional regulator [Deltaproteobacteria bacterium]MBW1893114.1 TetR/AcrR family transcriptional regulator [Deltaproteobacteria bacterium]MBW2218007.1 TetR/AcrR family transcriptional regulator [Deltaproteobacteria bacterium]
MTKTDKQQNIFDAALKLFARFGFKKTTVEDVAAEVGMTKSNLYFYVANKRELYEHTVGNALRQWRDSVAAAISNKDDAVEKFKVMTAKSFEYLSNHEELQSILIMDPGIFTLSPAEDRFYEINQGAMLLIKDILVQGIKEGQFYEVDIDHMTELLFSIYIMFLIKTYIKSEGSSAFRMYEEGVTLVLRGLCRKDL